MKEITPLPSLTELKKLLEDCFRIKPSVYWTDFTLFMLLGWASFIVTELSANATIRVLLFFVTSFCFYRCILFIHEISHMDRKDIPFFSVVYNLTIGVPLLLPSFMYRGVHLDHHKKNTYGTVDDGEYIAFGAHSPWRLLSYLALNLLVPILLYIRFAILNPISALSPKFRRELMERGSALAIQFEARRRIPTGIDLRNWQILDAMCTYHVLLMTSLLLLHVLHRFTFVHYYLVLAFIAFVNAVRTSVAHHYRNGSLHEMSFQDQLLDSINLVGNRYVQGLAAPVGLRFHALHHLFPSMPYHSLEKAHKRLIAYLPKNSTYRNCDEKSILMAFAKLWRAAQESEHVGQGVAPLRHQS